MDKPEIFELHHLHLYLLRLTKSVLNMHAGSIAKIITYCNPTFAVFSSVGTLYGRHGSLARLDGVVRGMDSNPVSELCFKFGAHSAR